MRIGLVTDNKTFGILQCSVGIGLQYGLERTLRTYPLFIYNVLVDLTVPAFYGYRNLSNQVVQRRTVGFGKGYPPAFAPKISVVRLYLRYALCRDFRYDTEYYE